MMSAMPSFSNTLEVAAAPEAVHAIIDDAMQQPEALAARGQE
jgi:hypothetical protein